MAACSGVSALPGKVAWLVSFCELNSVELQMVQWLTELG